MGADILTEVIAEQLCNGCEKSVLKIKKRYKGKRYCSACYAQIFIKKVCFGCGAFARLPRSDDQAMCNECIKKLPCVRCSLRNKPIGKITEYGPVCNSCSVYFRKIEPCDFCGMSSQKLTRISRFNDGLRVCPKCATRDYETCPSCHKYRLLELDGYGLKLCKKCKEHSTKPCSKCKKMIASGCSPMCDSCYWQENLWKKLRKNKNLFESKWLQNIYEEYIVWLESKVGSKQAALYINKHTHFFIKTENLWNDRVPTAQQLLMNLRSSGLRKFELILLWLYENYNIEIAIDEKNDISEIDQIERLIASLPHSSLGFETVNAYKNNLEVKISRGKTSVRSVRLALKPAVALILHVSQDGSQLPELKHVKTYLTRHSGQAAALTGYINFLNKNFDTSIDYLALKKSKLLTKKRQEKLEREMAHLLGAYLKDSKEVLKWIRLGLQYFHQLSYSETLKIKAEMIFKKEDGFIVLYKNMSFWLPKNNKDSRSDEA